MKQNNFALALTLAVFMTALPITVKAALAPSCTAAVKGSATASLMNVYQGVPYNQSVTQTGTCTAGGDSMAEGVTSPNDSAVSVAAGGTVTQNFAVANGTFTFTGGISTSGSVIVNVSPDDAGLTLSGDATDQASALADLSFDTTDSFTWSLICQTYQDAYCEISVYSAFSGGSTVLDYFNTGGTSAVFSGTSASFPVGASPWTNLRVNLYGSAQSGASANSLQGSSSSSNEATANYLLTITPTPTAATVPNVVGLIQTAATAAITGANLTLGAVTTQASTSIPSGQVISQSPAAGLTENDGTAVNLVVSSGPPTTTVPNVVGLTQAAAMAAITGASLTLGVVTTQTSTSVPSGEVISQSPAAGLSESDGTAVNLLVSSGPATTTVPDVVNLTQSAATAAITNAGLTLGTVSTQTSASVTAGEVISQSPAAGLTENDGTAVNLVVSTGPPTTTVPNVVGLTQAAATTAITGANLMLGTVTLQASTSVPSGEVISQSPAAALSESDGTAVNLVVSTGPPTTTVPNVVGLTQTAATAAITSANLTLGTVTTQASTMIASGMVISQSPGAGTSESDGTAVNLVVSSGPPTVVVALAGAPVIARTSQGWSVTVTVQNSGNVAIRTVQETLATLNGVDQTGVVLPIKNLAPKSTGTFVISFPRRAGTPGATVRFLMEGLYRATGLRGRWSVRLPAVTLPGP